LARLPEPYKACEEAVRLGKSLERILLATIAVGGVAALALLVMEHTGGDGDGVVIMDVPRADDPLPDWDAEPQPDPSGAGIKPPANCMDDTARNQLLEASPLNEHHVAAHENKQWTHLFEDIASRYGLDLNGEWNKMPGLRHRGPHPPEYHDWVRRNMERAHQWAQGDTDRSQAPVPAVVYAVGG
jgi:hypothetical protein